MSNRSKRARLGSAASPHLPTGRSRSLMVGAATAAAATMLVTGCGGSKAEGSKDPSAKGSAKLPEATTFAKLTGIPVDLNTANGDGTVVHPTAATPVSAQAGGPAVATLPSTQLGSPTWVPVVESKPGWQRVLLPSRPNGSMGWIPTDGGKVQTARSPYTIKVSLGARKLTILKAGHKSGSWTVAVGDAKTPTPTGRTFMLASLAPAKPTYSPLILPVGVHSATLDSFGGGPGTVAFHGWPTKSVFGQAVTHGCVRVPAEALTQLAKIPLGTPVDITA
ncbi:MAG: ErfK/YbiS/YcfS/YnhG family protein [Streptosporangiaceae bacterium]|nr:ErfK/YbiS/YcfS/YnhG family protein [Streptosporangiaceae bacterium]